MTTLSEDDEGKKVVDENGNDVGMVTRVEGTTAYVDPDPGITDRIMSSLGWEGSEEDEYALTEDRIETVTDDEVRLGNL